MYSVQVKGQPLFPQINCTHCPYFMQLILPFCDRDVAKVKASSVKFKSLIFLFYCQPSIGSFNLMLQFLFRPKRRTFLYVWVIRKSRQTLPAELTLKIL